MASEIKINANRENAKKSTGPRTSEGKAAVSQNALKHGIRSRHAALLMEDHHEYKEILRDFRDEWNPATLTEEDLVEQMVVNKWKLARYEAAESQACTQSTLVHLALKGPNDYKRNAKGHIKPVDIVCKREADAERSVTRINQMIARVERSYFRALQFLLRLQDLRLKRQRQQQQPSRTDVAASQSAPRTRTAGATASAAATPISVAAPVPVCRR